MALEIHSREKLSSSQEGCFFSRLGNLWQDRGTKIIPADIYRLPERNNFEYLINIFPRKFLTAMRIIDKGILRTLTEKKPQVVVLGQYHADYQKRVFPNARYIALLPINPEEKPKTADEIVTLDCFIKYSGDGI
jgi:hypothetical protein